MADHATYGRRRPRLCENMHERRTRSIVFSIVFPHSSRQCFYFTESRNRERFSTRGLRAGVFTQARPFSDILDGGVKGTRTGGQPPPSARQPYHTQGTRRYLTLCIYSAYPGKSLRRKFSSSRIRQTSTGKNGTTRRTLHHEPSASGIAKSRSNAPEYIGCRTYA